MDFTDPKVKELWDQWESLVWWTAKKIADRRGVYDRNLVREELLGSLAEVFVKCAKSYDPARGKFSTLFVTAAWRSLDALFLRYDAEWRDLDFTRREATSAALKQQRVEYAYHEANDFYLYRVPEEDEDSMAVVVSTFETPQACWDFFCQGLRPRWRWVLEQRYREGRTFESIRQEMGISKQRVCQITNVALRDIRRRLDAARKFTDLFVKHMRDD